MVNNSYIAIAPRNETEAYVCWDLNQYDLQQMSGQSNPVLTLYICDITDLDRNELAWSPVQPSTPHCSSACLTSSVVSTARKVQSYTLQSHVHECYVPIPSLNRDYVAELGYVDTNGQWLMLTQSMPLRMYPIRSNE